MDIVVIVLIVILSLIAAYFVSTFIASMIVFVISMRRNTRKKWTRKPSYNNPDYLEMYKTGIDWQKQFDDKKIPVHIVNDRLNLYGEYYDFGSDNCAIVISGRAEALNYGYYFAKPYVELGMNFLVLDQRCHGDSDGTYNTMGHEESKDLICWIKYIQEKFSVKNVYLHGICIGGACCMYAVTSDDCPKCVKAVVVEGMFARFSDNMNSHLRERNRDKFPLLYFINLWIKLFTRHTMFYGPVDVMHKMTKPLLMIHCRVDEYSESGNATTLYDMCKSKIKRLVWFDKGKHSKLRHVDTEKYDTAVKDFMNEVMGSQCEASNAG